MKFKDKVINSLAVYRKNKLGINELGVFNYRGQELLKEHILPTNFKTHNIIQNYRDSFYSSPSSEIEFHKYYHHLNSSQALCINLFFPLIQENKLSLILNLLRIPKQPITEACFEKESDLEIGAGRKTNFDFYLCLSNQTKIFFEIKYTESEFGKANNDNEHRAKYANTYQPLLTNKDFIKPEFCNVDKFLDSYQIMRNLCHITETSFVVFVYPKANEKINLQAQSACDDMLTEKGKNRFKILTLEAAADDILGQLKEPMLQEHYNEFKGKYLNYIM